MKNIILIAISALLFSGCVTEKKAKRYAYNHKDKLAEWCLDCFEDKKEVVYVKGDTSIVKLDTIINIDSTNITILDCPDGTKLGCPPPKVKTIYKHTHSVDTAYKDRWQTLALVEKQKGENQELTNINNSLIEQNNKISKSLKNWRNIALIAIGLIGLSLLFFTLKSKLKNYGGNRN